MGFEGWFFKGGSTQNRWVLEIFFLPLKIRCPGPLFRKIRYVYRNCYIWQQAYIWALNNLHELHVEGEKIALRFSGCACLFSSGDKKRNISRNITLPRARKFKALWTFDHCKGNYRISLRLFQWTTVNPFYLLSLFTQWVMRGDKKPLCSMQ